MAMKKILLILFVLTAYFFPKINEYLWSSYTVMDDPVAGAVSLLHGDYIYILGGYSDNLQGNTNWIQKFDTLSGNFEIVDTMKAKRYGLSGVETDSGFYYFGGVYDTSISARFLEYYDPASENGSVVVDTNELFNRINASSVLIGESLYIIGGNPYVSNLPEPAEYIVEYNLATKEITKHETIFSGVEDLPEQQMTAVFDSLIYIFGGVINGISRNIYSFNINSKVLAKQLGTLLSPRASADVTTYIQSNQVLISGGFNEGNSALATTEIFKLISSATKIIPGPTLETARSKPAVKKINNVFFAFGGFNTNGDVISDVEKLYDENTNDVEYDPVLPDHITLEQNYPNPFNPETSIKFAVPTRENVVIDVYNILGKNVATLVNGEFDSGTYTIRFNSEEFNLSSGVYIYHLTAGKYTISKKMTLLK